MQPFGSIFVCSYESTVGTVTRPQASIYASSTRGFALLEAAATGASSANFRLRLVRLSTQDFATAAQTEAKYDPDTAAPTATCFGVHTGAETVTDRLHQNRGALNIAVGVGYSFHDEPIKVRDGITNGMGWMADVAATGTCDFTWVWEE